MERDSRGGAEARRGVRGDPSGVDGDYSVLRMVQKAKSITLACASG